MDTFDLKKYLAENRLFKENLKFKNLNPGNNYTATQDFSIFKKGDSVKIQKITPFGAQSRVYMKNSQGKVDNIIGDFEEEVEVLRLNEVEVTDPELQSQIQEFATLSDEIDRINNTLKKLKDRYSSLSDILLPLLNELAETKDNALEVEDILVTIKKKGYERTSVGYKEAFEWLKDRVNPQMKKIVEEALEKTKKTSQIAPAIGVQRRVDENKVVDILSKYWNKFVVKLDKLNDVLKQDIDVFRSKLK